MKKWQKFVLLVMSFNILFFTVESKKREAEAFALSTLALTVGGLATVAVGGYVINKAITSDLGQRILDNFNSTGQNHKDFIVENMVTGVTKINMNRFMRSAIEKSIQEEVENVPTTDQSVYTLSSLKASGFKSTHTIPTGFKDLQIGEYLEVTLDYAISGWVSYIKVSDGNSRNDKLEIGNTDSIYREGSAKHIFQMQRNSNYLDLIIENPNSSKPVDIQLSNIKIERVTYAESPAVQRYKQFANVPRTLTGISEQVNTNLNDATYEIDNQKEIIGAQSLDDIKAQVEEITENTSQTNSFIQKLITAVGNVPNVIMSGINSAFGWLQGLLTNIWNAILGIPAAVAGAMSGLWEDAGLVWSGIKDSVSATNNWLNNVLTGALDGLSNGIDNLSRVFQDTWAGIESGLAAIGQNVLALPQTLLDDLTEIKTAVTALAIPTALDMSTYTNKMDELRQNMTSKFEFITLPMQQIKSVFAAPKSLYDVKFTILNHDVYVLPRMFEPVVNITKNVLTGSAVISTFIAIYRRFTPEEVIA